MKHCKLYDYTGRVTSELSGVHGLRGAIFVIVIVVVVPWLWPVCWRTSVVRSERAGLLHRSILGKCGRWWWGGRQAGRLCTRSELLKLGRKNGGLTVMESMKEQRWRLGDGRWMQRSAGNRV